MHDPTRPNGRRLYQQIADQIRALIAQGQFQPGSRLPPERELAQLLGVSRPSVREALIALEIGGRVEVRQGAGVYVRRAEAGAGAEPEETASLGESPMELMQARVALEGAVVVQACARATPAQLATVRQALEGMRAAVSGSRPALDADRHFHLAIAAMTGNSVLERLVRELYDERYSPLSRQLSEHAESPQTWVEALAEHEAIVLALESRDALAAQTLMRAHLVAAQDRWLSSGLR